MKIQIEVDHDTVDKIVRTELKWHKEMANDTKGLCEEDRKYFKKLAPALEIVCEYFGVDQNDQRRNK